MAKLLLVPAVTRRKVRLLIREDVLGKLLKIAAENGLEVDDLVEQCLTHALVELRHASAK